MVAAAEGIIGPVHQECVTCTASSKGKYTSVRMGPVWVQSSDQVVAVYEAMRKDTRLKMYL